MDKTKHRIRDMWEKKKNNIYVISVPEAGDKERKQVKSNI